LQKFIRQYPDMIKHFIMVGLGGALGSILRYLTQLLFAAFSLTFPMGTFVANILGCFAIGLLYALMEKYTGLSTEWRLFWITGICGGYTTFSSFSYESISLFKQGNYFYFFLYMMMSIVVGLLATLVGIVVVSKF
jgi:fluoride exporter